MIEHALGTITHGDDVLADGVDEWIERIPRGNLYEWHGGLTLPEGHSVFVGVLYRLELDDGRSGEISIDRQQMTSSGQKETIFNGSGPLE